MNLIPRGTPKRTRNTLRDVWEAAKVAILLWFSSNFAMAEILSPSAIFQRIVGPADADDFVRRCVRDESIPPRPSSRRVRCIVATVEAPRRGIKREPNARRNGCHTSLARAMASGKAFSSRAREALRNVLGGVSGRQSVAAWVVAGTAAYFLWIRPEQIAKQKKEENTVSFSLV